MRLAALCLVVLAGTVEGQTISDQFIDRLAWDLMPLRTVAPVKPESLRKLQDLTGKERVLLRMFVAEKSPEMNRIMQGFVDDVSERYGKPVVSWELSYALAGALAGKPLEDVALQRLARSIVVGVDVAVACGKTASPVAKSAKFRATAELTYDQLLALGVDSQTASIVIESLIRGGKILSVPPIVKPISPLSQMQR